MKEREVEPSILGSENSEGMEGPREGAAAMITTANPVDLSSWQSTPAQVRMTGPFNPHNCARMATHSGKRSTERLSCSL